MAGLSPVDDVGPDTMLPALPVLQISEEKRSKRNPKQLDFESVSSFVVLSGYFEAFTV